MKKKKNKDGAPCNGNTAAAGESSDTRGYRSCVCGATEGKRQYPAGSFEPASDVLLENNCRPRAETAPARNVSYAPIRRGRRTDGLRTADRRPLSPRRDVRRQDSERREARRSSGRTADEVRIRCQS